MSDYKPGGLGLVDEVHVLDLRGTSASQVSEYIRLPNLEFVVVKGDQAQNIAGLWRALPSGNQARCHIPPFGLRFFRDGEEVVGASLCWDCNNVMGYEGDRCIFFEFNAGATPSKALLRCLKRVWA